VLRESDRGCGSLVSYAPRPIRFIGVRAHGGWRFKEYAITLRDDGLQDLEFAAGVRAALAELPAAAVARGRPGVGFLILHAGRGAAYVVLAWWDNENELPMRIFVRGAGEQGWRPAGSRESVCVWDLEVIGFERQAYVDTFLASEPGAPAYLSRHFGHRKAN
jgi:hypothetical protein